MLRLRTHAAKWFNRADRVTAVIWKMLMMAEKRFRRLNARGLLEKVYGGVQFQDGVEASQPQEDAASTHFYAPLDGTPHRLRPRGVGLAGLYLRPLIGTGPTSCSAFLRGSSILVPSISRIWRTGLRWGCPCSTSTYPSSMRRRLSSLGSS